MTEKDRKEKEDREIKRWRAFLVFKERLRKRNPPYLTQCEIRQFLNLRTGGKLRDQIKNRAMGICRWMWVTKIGLIDYGGTWMGSWIAKLQPMKKKGWWKKVQISLRSNYCGPAS